MATGFTDFGGAEVGGGIPSGWSSTEYYWNSAPVLTVDVVENASAPSGKALSISSDTFNAASVLWTDLTAFADGEIVMLYRVPFQSSGWHGGPAVRADGGDPPTMVLELFDNANNFVKFNYHPANDTGQDLLAQVSQAIANDEWWWTRINFSGTSYKFRWWKLGNDEPETWNKEGTKAEATTSAGYIGWAGGMSGGAVHLVGALGWSDDPGTSAPTSGGGGGGGGADFGPSRAWDPSPVSRTAGFILNKLR